MSKPFGPGETPNRCTTLPENAAGRKRFPIASGVLDYFPDALAAIAEVSRVGNDQHNPGEPLHWARGKSMDQDDTIIRHFLQRGTRDTSDGHNLRHSAKMAWRTLALLQLEIEAEQAEPYMKVSGQCSHHLAVGDGKDFRCLRTHGHDGDHYFSGGSK